MPGQEKETQRTDDAVWNEREKAVQEAGGEVLGENELSFLLHTQMVVNPDKDARTARDKRRKDRRDEDDDE